MNPKALHKISYGLYIITSFQGEKINGQTANTFFQVTSDPPTIAVAINKQNLTHEFISQSGFFAASILSQEAPLSLIGKFGFRSGRDIDKFEGLDFRSGKNGPPIVLEHTLAYLEMEVINQLDVGSHTIFAGKALEGDILKDGEPMTYAYYHQIKRGTTPKTAPTFIRS